MIFDASVGERVVRVEVKGRDGRFTVAVEGRVHEVEALETSPGFLSLLVEGTSHDVGLSRTAGGYRVVTRDEEVEVELAAGAPGAGAAVRRVATGPLRLTAPMPGKIVRVLVAVGDDVAAGQGLVVMEAMKMENELKAARGGRVKTVEVREGQAVETGTLLATVE